MFGNGFAPGASGTIAATTSSQSVAVTGKGKTLYVANAGTTECFVAVGSSDVVAVAGAGITGLAGHMSVMPGICFALAMDRNTHVAAITASGTTTLRFTRGDGQ